ncbi:hypothetical protein [Paenibacillus arenilitoris]|uniref:Tissue inhibitor of metalloproteinase n=1 Tax=Paenibacillus arenilitoris TaxID=2772299 RepID=A0A927CNB9_9BACL|nr:hypothetical protein [Paenibacillus arenilitoris]MBD2871169.1 hypothetical protein [Paenibacillus arenilitoris]
MMLRRGTLMLLALLTLTVGMAILPAQAAACSCAEPGTLTERKDRSHAVFEGEVAAVKSSSASLFQPQVRTVKATFKVNEVWKGQVARTIEVITAEDGATCGFRFEEGERYLVFANAKGKSLETGLCSGNVKHDGSAAYAAPLGSGSIPPMARAADLVHSAFPSRAVLWPIIAAVFVLVCAYLVYYKNKKAR